MSKYKDIIHTEGNVIHVAFGVPNTTVKTYKDYPISVLRAILNDLNTWEETQSKKITSLAIGIDDLDYPWPSLDK